MKKSLLIMICVLLCMFAFTAGVSANVFDPIPAFENTEKDFQGISVFADDASANTLNFTNNLPEGEITATQSQWGSKYCSVYVNSYGVNQAALPAGTVVSYAWYSSTDNVIDANDKKVYTGPAYSIPYKETGILYYYVIATATIDGKEYSGTSNILCVKVGAASVNVSLTVNNKGVLAADKNGAAVSSSSVNVLDLDYDGKLTYDEALIAAHKSLKSEDDYATSETAYGLAVTKFWGVETGNVKFFLNGEELTNHVGAVTVVKNAALYVSINQDDKYYSDKFVTFDVGAKTWTKDLALDLTLMDGKGNAVSGIQIGTWVEGKFVPMEGKTTDVNGKVTLTFAESGTYIVTASGAINATAEDWSSGSLVEVPNHDCPIMAPACTITVKDRGNIDFTGKFPENTFNVKVGEPLGIENLFNAIFKINETTDKTIAPTVTWYRINQEGNGVAEPVTDIKGNTTESDIGTWQYYVYAECEAYGVKYSARSNFANVVISEATPIEGSFVNGFVSDISYTSGGYSQDIDFAVHKTDYEIIEYDASQNDYLNVDLNCYGVWYGLRINGIKPTSVFLRDKEHTAFSSANKFTINIPSDFTAGSSNAITLLVGTKYDSNGDGVVTYTDDFDKFDAYNFSVKTMPALSLLSVSDSNGENIALDKTVALNAYCGASDLYGVTDSESIKLTADFKSANGVKVQIGKTEYSARLINEEISLSRDATGVANIPIKVFFIDESGENFEHTYNLHLSHVPSFDPPVITKQPISEISIAKDTTVELSVEAKEPAKGTLSYQWYGSTYDGNFDNESNLIKGATSATYNAPARDVAGYYWYACKVTLTIDDATISVLSDSTEVKTELTYPAKPEFVVQPGIAAKKDGCGAYKKEYIAGNKFDPMYFSVAPVGLTKTHNTTWESGCNNFELQCYYNTVASTEGAKPLEGTFQMTGGGFGTFYSFTPEKSLPAGEHYIYFVVSVSIKDNPLNSSSGTSDFVKLNFAPAELGFEGSGEATDPYILKSGDDFVAIQKLVEQGETLSGMYFEMANDITLPEDWESIGSNGPGGKHFSGILDGNGYQLNFTKGSPSLIYHAKNAEIKNLKIYGEEIQGPALIASSWVNQTPGAWIAKINNITLLSGTSTLKSGLVNGSASTYNPIYISNCVAEEGVVIGYDKQQSYIGTFAGSFLGSISNCSSAATVYGVNNVGGIYSTNSNAMGAGTLSNLYFTGKIEATGNNIGGIVGAGYNAVSAPNGMLVSIQNCYVNAEITGKQNVGGLLGADAGVQQAWDNGIGYIRNNVFCGTLTGEKYVGGLVGYYSALNKYNVIEGNYFYDANGCKDAIGGVEHIDTSAREFGMNDDGIFYYNTSVDSLDEIKEFVDAEDKGTADWQYTSVAKKDHNRTDDPMGKDKDKLGTPVTAEAMTDGTVLALLNASEYGMQNWIQGENCPVIDDKVVAVELALSGNYKTEYYIGDELDTTGMVFTATYSDGSTGVVPTEEIKLEGFDSTARALVKVTASYGAAATTFEVKVGNKPVSNDITVYFTLLGDEIHEVTEDEKTQHTLINGGLQTWIERTEIKADINATVKDVLLLVLEQNNMTHTEGAGGNYIASIIRDDVELGEFTNGLDSGWMYTLNGVHSDLGVKEQFLENGDEIVFHYTDNYHMETPSENIADHRAADKTEALISAIGTVTKDSKTAIDAARNGYNALTEDQKALVENYNILVAAEKAFAELNKPGETDKPVDSDPKDEVVVVDPSELPFTDLTTDWYKEAVAYVYSYGLMNGTSDTTFAPDVNLNRAMMATILYRIEGEPKVTSANPFTDVPAGQWYTDAIIWAAENKIVEGYGDGIFKPTTDINREQMAAMMYRYAKFKGADVSAADDLAAFNDAATVSDWAKESMKWAVAVDLINGMGNNTLAPQNTATRAQAATVLMRFNENIIK